MIPLNGLPMVKNCNQGSSKAKSKRILISVIYLVHLIIIASAIRFKKS